MAFTQDDLAAIDKAIASGELTVKYGDTVTTYRSIAELKQARAMIQDELNAASGTAPKTYTLAATSKG